MSGTRSGRWTSRKPNMGEKTSKPIDSQSCVAVLYMDAGTACIGFNVSSYSYTCDVCKKREGGFVYESQAENAAKKHIRKEHM